MFREMRRKNQKLTIEECNEILHRGSSGVLAVAGDNDYPYAVPLSYVHLDGKIYFHCAKQGHKLDAIIRNNKISFCVIDQDEIVPEEYTTHFKSVIAFGKIRILEEETEKRTAIELLGRKYAPENTEEELQAAVEKDYAPLCMLELSIEHISGKQSKYLVKK